MSWDPQRMIWIKEWLGRGMSGLLWAVVPATTSRASRRQWMKAPVLFLFPVQNKKPLILTVSLSHYHIISLYNTTVIMVWKDIRDLPCIQNLVHTKTKIEIKPTLCQDQEQDQLQDQHQTIEKPFAKWLLWTFQGNLLDAAKWQLNLSKLHHGSQLVALVPVLFRRTQTCMDVDLQIHVTCQKLWRVARSS